MAQRKNTGKKKEEATKGKRRKKKEEQKEQEVAEEKSEKRSPLKLILFILVPLLILGGGGFAAWKFVLNKPKRDEKAAAKEEEKKKKIPLSYLSLDPFVVNLQGSGRRFLKMSITLALEGDKGAEVAQKEIPPIRNAILLLLTNKRFEEVTTMEGKKQLQKEILDRVNQLLEGTKVKEVYFTEFIAQ